jgi:hypothetical protein
MRDNVLNEAGVSHSYDGKFGLFFYCGLFTLELDLSSDLQP